MVCAVTAALTAWWGPWCCSSNLVSFTFGWNLFSLVCIVSRLVAENLAQSQNVASLLICKAWMEGGKKPPSLRLTLEKLVFVQSLLLIIFYIFLTSRLLFKMVDLIAEGKCLWFSSVELWVPGRESGLCHPEGAVRDRCLLDEIIRASCTPILKANWLVSLAQQAILFGLYLIGNGRSIKILNYQLNASKYTSFCMPRMAGVRCLSAMFFQHSNFFENLVKTN